MQRCLRKSTGRWPRSRSQGGEATKLSTLPAYPSARDGTGSNTCATALICGISLLTGRGQNGNSRFMFGFRALFENRFVFGIPAKIS